jgi:hypothetical protein
LSEIGQHYDFIDESVNDAAQFVAPDQDIHSRIRVADPKLLPTRASGAIIGFQRWRRQ